MPARTYELDAEARHELDEAIGFFESQRPGRGIDFLEAVYDDIALLVEYPLAGRMRRDRFRSFVMAKWPYKIIYAVKDDVVVVSAIAHHKRRPNYWRKRARR
jgi:toxin ParE1/3/4